MTNEHKMLKSSVLRYSLAIISSSIFLCKKSTVLSLALSIFVLKLKYTHKIYFLHKTNEKPFLLHIDLSTYRLWNCRDAGLRFQRGKGLSGRRHLFVEPGYHTTSRVVLVQSVTELLPCGLQLLSQREAVQHYGVPFVLQGF